MEQPALIAELDSAHNLLAGTGYVAERVLGKGGFGLVVLAKHMDYPHIVRMHEVFRAGPSHVGIAMEYCSGSRIPWEAQSRWFFQQLVLALEYCHTKGVVHRDVKLENVVLQTVAGVPLPEVHLADFGLSEQLDARGLCMARGGTRAYAAPELLQRLQAGTGHQAYDGKKADVWALGVLLFALLFNSYPFSSTRQLLAAEVHYPDPLKAGYRPVSPDCMAVLRSMLQLNPADRPSIDDLITTAWFQQQLPTAASWLSRVSTASGVWDPQSGQLMADQLRWWKLTKGQLKHASGLNNARRDTERWLAPIKPHLQHLAAASSAGTSLEANLKHITVTLATWDAVWEVYLDPKWAQQRLRLYGAQDRALEQVFNKLEEDMAELSMKRHGRAKQLVVFFGAATIGTGGGWGADAVLRACRKVVCRPRGTDQQRGRVVLVDEHRATRVSSAVNGKQPCEEELDKLSATRPAGWKPPAGQVEPRLVRPAWSQERGQPVRGLMWCPVVAPRKPPQAPRSSQAATQPAASEPGPSTPPPAKRSKPAAEPTKGKGKGKAAKAKPGPQPGRWVDRDCNAALNMQRIGESRWRPLELCYWPDQGALPAKGKEYPDLGYKRLQDKPPRAQYQ
ncbi:hypothetical protein QJQ45_009926 [Haematococcus lacustris]|nr:hypothetical protein QJQ45_009926 [Haematococcus lacustris]